MNNQAIVWKVRSGNNTKTTNRERITKKPNGNTFKAMDEGVNCSNDNEIENAKNSI